jgi:hypothetical protein
MSGHHRKDPMMADDFNTLFHSVRPRVNEYFDLWRRQRAAHNGERWFRNDHIAEQGDQIARDLEEWAATFRREAEHFRTGR